MEYKRLIQALGYVFRDRSLLELALTHSSWSNEHHVEGHNERLEFLGDAVLELSISSTLYARFSEAREGDLTRFRSLLVSTPSLADAARRIGLDAVLRLGKGEDRQGGRQRDALLADAMEAVLGGVFLDGGFEAATAVVLRLFEGHWPERLESDASKDFKSRLQEETQRLLRSLPTYTLLESEGPEHDKSFTVRVDLSDGRSFIGRSSGVKRAEHEAARQALEALEGSANALHGAGRQP